MHCPLLIALTALFCLATAIPAPIDGSHSLNITVSEAPNSSVTTFPVCGTFGFTAYPNDNDLGVFPPPPVALKDCIWSCRLNHTCKAVSYAAKYQLCSFYSRYMKFDNLDEEKTSSFTHYDEVCPFLEEGKES